MAHSQASQRSLHIAPIFRMLLKVAVNWTQQCEFFNVCGTFESQQCAIFTPVCVRFCGTWFLPIGRMIHIHLKYLHWQIEQQKQPVCFSIWNNKHILALLHILAEGAIALSVTLSGGALFASWELLQFPSSLIVKVILASFMRASAQQTLWRSGADRCLHVYVYVYVHYLWVCLGGGDIANNLFVLGMRFVNRFGRLKFIPSRPFGYGQV